jgi:radical SAM superfamily enzyme YgiQ (UPF0313 family)
VTTGRRNGKKNYKIVVWECKRIDPHNSFLHITGGKKSMRILFIKPPLNPHLFGFTRYEPLEFEYLAASVPEHEVEILDMRIEKNLIKKLDSFKPDLVGSTAYTSDVNTARSLMKEVKKHDSSIHIVIGGHHATFVPEDFAQSYIDTIFIGYADQSFKEYVDTLEEGENLEGVHNIALVKNGTLLFTDSKPFLDLNSLPLPARDLTRNYRKKYRDSYWNRTALIMTSRGCPFRCTFCACWKLMNGRYVTRNIDSVIEEIESIPEDVEIIDFSDDNTFHNVPRAWKLAEAIKKMPVKRRFKMYARADMIVKHPDLFASLREAGLENLTVGIESIDDEELSALNKKTSVTINNEAIQILKRLGIFIDAHFIVNPDFTVDNFERLFRYVTEKCLFRNTFAVLTPLPGTDLYDDTVDRLAIRDYDYFDLVHSVLPTTLSRKVFYKQLARIYRKSYGPGRYMRFKLNNSLRGTKDIKNHYAYNTDGLNLLQLTMLHIFAIPLFIKMHNIYKTEPVLDYSSKP